MTKYVQPTTQAARVTEDFSDFFDYLTEYIDESRNASASDSYGGLWFIELNEQDYNRAFNVVQELRYKKKQRIIWNGGLKIEEKENRDKRDTFTLTYLKNEFKVVLNRKKKQRTFKKS